METCSVQSHLFHGCAVGHRPRVPSRGPLWMCQLYEELSGQWWGRLSLADARLRTGDSAASQPGAKSCSLRTRVVLSEARRERISVDLDRKCATNGLSPHLPGRQRQRLVDQTTWDIYQNSLQAHWWGPLQMLVVSPCAASSPSHWPRRVNREKWETVSVL